MGAATRSLSCYSLYCLQDMRSNSRKHDLCKQFAARTPHIHPGGEAKPNLQMQDGNNSGAPDVAIACAHNNHARLACVGLL